MWCMFVYVHAFEYMLVCTHKGSLFASKNPTGIPQQPLLAYFFFLSALVPRTELKPPWHFHGRLNHGLPGVRPPFLLFPLACISLLVGPLLLTCNSCSRPLFPCPGPCPLHCPAHCLVPPSEIVTSWLFVLRLTSPSLVVINCLFRLA